jgi:hypothetical protein
VAKTRCIRECVSPSCYKEIYLFDQVRVHGIYAARLVYIRVHIYIYIYTIPLITFDYCVYGRCTSADAARVHTSTRDIHARARTHGTCSELYHARASGMVTYDKHVSVGGG